MELSLKGKRALVTAAGRGIGRAISQSLAREGAKVAVFSRVQEDIDSLVDAMGGEEGGHYGQSFDLLPEGAPGKLVEILRDRFGPIDIVIHNLGGTLDITDPLCSLDDWRKVWRFNFEVAVELNQALLPHMRDQGWGRVVHIASTSSVENNGPITNRGAQHKDRPLCL